MNEVVARVAFDVSPFKTGDIVCHTDSGELNPPQNRFIYVSSGTECTANPSKGYEFSSWGEVLEDNSTRTITSTSGSPITALLDSLNLKYDDPAAKLVVNKFGNFTAYFRALPAPLPAGYWASLFAVVVTALVGSLLIPAMVGWFKSKKQTLRLNSYHNEMNTVYNDGRLDKNDISKLNKLNKDISDAYSMGKINNEQYTNLKNEVSIAYEEIFRREIVNREADLQQIQEDISSAYSKGKIIKLHYDLLNEKISKMTPEKE